jgi:uncharacterized protein (TIGR03083 family)
MDLTWTSTRRAFSEAARWFADTVPQVGDRWDSPGLGEWDVRALVGHTSRALLTVEAYLATPATRVDIPTPSAYLRATTAVAAGTDVTARGRAAGAALGADPVASVAAVAERVVALVDAEDGTALVTTLAGGMRLADYVPTRTFELVVHTCDLAGALGIPADVPRDAVGHALALVAAAAAERGDAAALLLALTGRAALPEGYSVLA